MKAKANDNVKVHYTGKLTTGEIFDSSVGRDPLAFTVGSGQMIKGFEQAVNGMELNERKTVTVLSEQAYGTHKAELVQVVSRTSLPNDMKPEVGRKLIATNDLGHQTQVLVTEVTVENITVDANHDLAGKDLVFEIELVEIAAN